MLGDISPLKERIHGANCITLAFSNVLKYKQYKNYKYIWKQCGMNYIKKTNNAGYLNAKFLSITEELMLGDPIYANFVEHDSAEEMILSIKSYIDKGEPVIVFVDTFELSYHMCYKDKHAKHCLIITGYEGNTFNFVDDFYQIQDVISFETLKKSTVLRLDHDITHGIITVEIKNKLMDSKEVILSTIATNNMALEGELNIDSKVGDIEVVHKGLNGIQAFIEEYASYAMNNEFLTEDTFDDLYTILSRISNTRYLYSSFLSREKQEFSSELFNSLFEGYFHSGQEWKVCSNMMIKAAKAKPHKKIELFNRMIKKLHSINDLEFELLDKSKRFVEITKREVNEVLENGVK